MGVTILDNSPALQLLVDTEGAVAGATGINRQTEKQWVVRAGAVIIAIGGCAFLSKALGCNVLTGDGYLMAAEAGAEMSGMEFSNAYGISPAFSSVTKTLFYNWATFTYEDGPRSVAELKGQKVATSKGSYMHRYLIGLLQKNGISDRVKVIHMLPSEAQAALERGDVAAIAASTGTGPLLKSKGYPVIDEAIQHPDLRGTSVTVATEEFLAKHPDLPQKWNQIKQAAVKDIQANPEAYYKFHADVSGYPLDVVKASFPITQFPIEPLPEQGVQLLEGTKKFLVSQKLAQSDFKLDDWIVKQ